MKRLVLSLVALAGCGLFASPAMAGGHWHGRAHIVRHEGYWRSAPAIVCPAPAVCAPPVVNYEPAYQHVWHGYTRHYVRGWHRR